MTLGATVGVTVVGLPVGSELMMGEYEGVIVGGKVSPLQCSGVVPHQPNMEQHFPLAQMPFPRSPFPHVPLGFTMTSSADDVELLVAVELVAVALLV